MARRRGEGERGKEEAHLHPLVHLIDEILVLLHPLEVRRLPPSSRLAQHLPRIQMPLRRPNRPKELEKVGLDGGRAGLGGREGANNGEVLRGEPGGRSVGGVIAIPLADELGIASVESGLHVCGKAEAIFPSSGGVGRGEDHGVVEVSLCAHDSHRPRLLHAILDLLRAGYSSIGENGHSVAEQLRDGLDFGPGGETGESAFGFSDAAVDGDELGAGGEDVRGVGEGSVEGGEDSEFGDDGDGEVGVKVGDCRRER